VYRSHDLVTRDLRLFALVAVVACLGPFGLASAADAQQPASPRRIGVLLGGLSPESKEAQAFRQGLLDAGYSEGRDVVIEWRTAGGDYARLPELAADLVQRKVDVIVVQSTLAGLAVKRATSTIPIVMATVADPIGSGLVANLAHPGGNVTGLSTMVVELSAKRLQLLKEALPRVVRVAVLGNPATPYHSKAVEDLKAVSSSLSIELNFVAARTPEEFGPAFSAVSRARAQALYVIDDAFFVSRRAMLVKLASKARLPAIYGFRLYVDEGGLISYGANYADLLRRSAGFVDKILKGAKPGDLPIEQPTKFELVVNLKTAKALGITIPKSILLQADEVIR
jgi:putative tryptophan/tyrosine transport system substrate-binding protein